MIIEVNGSENEGEKNDPSNDRKIHGNIKGVNWSGALTLGVLEEFAGAGLTVLLALLLAAVAGLEAILA